jgi:hypothetical protein
MLVDLCEEPLALEWECDVPRNSTVTRSSFGESQAKLDQNLFRVPVELI